MGQLEPGDEAPSFTLRTHLNQEWSLDGALTGGPVVLFFYPKDDTPVCIAEACAFRDRHQVFSDRGAQVVGISSDDVATHKSFADRYDLPYTLLSDPEAKVRDQFGVKRTLGFFEGRVTFVIGRDRRVAHTHSAALDAESHVVEALNALASLD